jgi:hypothetical protein
MTEEIKKYTVEIYDCDNPRKERKEAYLYDFEGIELLFKDIVNDNELIEFSGIMRRNDELIHDDYDDVDLVDFNIIEITSIKKVKKYA